MDMFTRAKEAGRKGLHCKRVDPDLSENSSTWRRDFGCFTDSTFELLIQQVDSLASFSRAARSHHSMQCRAVWVSRLCSWSCCYHAHWAQSVHAHMVTHTHTG